MRGKETTQQSFFSYIMPENRIPHDHPLRPIKQMVNKALIELSMHFSRIYASMGRPSIPPEMLLRATLLQILYSIRSERLLMEQLDYNILFRWFVGLSMDDAVWDHSVFSKNRERLLNTDVAAAFFASVRQQAEAAQLLSDEHFTVDGTLIEAWASLKSFRPKDDGDLPNAQKNRNPEVNFHGQQRKNETHESKTDPDARLYRKGKGKEARLSYMGHVLMENRNGLVVDGNVTKASGTAEPRQHWQCWTAFRASVVSRLGLISSMTSRPLCKEHGGARQPPMSLLKIGVRLSMVALPVMLGTK
jgi:transposase